MSARDAVRARDEARKPRPEKPAKVRKLEPVVDPVVEPVSEHVVETPAGEPLVEVAE